MCFDLCLITGLKILDIALNFTDNTAITALLLFCSSILCRQNNGLRWQLYFLYVDFEMDFSAVTLDWLNVREWKQTLRFYIYNVSGLQEP